MQSRRIPTLLAMSVALLGGCATGIDGTRFGAPSSFEPWRVIRDGSGTADARYALGRSHLAAGRLEQARHAFLEALRSGSGDPDVRNALAVTYVRLGAFADAATQLEAAIASAPGRADLHGNLGYVRMVQGRDADAAASLDRSLALDPGVASVIRNRESLAGRLASRAASSSRLAGDTAQPTVREGAAVSNRAASPAPASPSSSGVGVVNVDFGPAPALAPTPAAADATRRVPTSAPAPAPRTGIDDAVAVPRPVRLEIANGTGVRHQAARLTQRLRSPSTRVVAVTNADRFTYSRTRILFRDGYFREAQALARRLAVDVELVPMRDPSTSGLAELRIVTGMDLASTASVGRVRRPAPIAMGIQARAVTPAAGAIR